MIQSTKKGIKIKLNEKFYDKNVLEESLGDFRQICTGRIINKKTFFIVTLKPKRKEVRGILGYEFCNYVLGLMKNKTLV